MFYKMPHNIELVINKKWKTNVVPKDDQEILYPFWKRDGDYVIIFDGYESKISCNGLIQTM